ncbi:GNAT family N-acetyltransferase [Halobacillus trueperi]|uniref:N-acetyltransferase n=1 Tax=Halobacillus trueperi TaxID=156205 RepID=A0A3E0J3A8_9BACI|nr:GNAT family protein [Halobacillus trueperi]REJ07309.1 N-acetyltransferase [Halobacillus trueperi]
MDVIEENDRIYLREVLLEDWSAFHPYSSNEETVKHQPWGPNTEEDSLFFVRQVIIDRKQRHRSRYVFTIVEKEMDQVVGNIEMNIRDWDGVGEIGFIIHHDYWGKGLATEAVQLMINYCFEHCELQRVVATSNPENIGSIKVLEKVGMIKEGTLRKDLLVKGKWQDSCVYSMLREEWIEKSARL